MKTADQDKATDDTANDADRRPSVCDPCCDGQHIDCEWTDCACDCGDDPAYADEPDDGYGEYKDDRDHHDR